jgi:hypothetical protein
MLAEHGVLPAFVYTSLQQQTTRTADLALAAADRDWIPVRRSWRLNGRHYGPEQGLGAPAVRRAAGPALAPLVRHRPVADHRGGLAAPAERPSLSWSCHRRHSRAPNPCATSPRGCHRTSTAKAPTWPSGEEPA